MSTLKEFVVTLHRKEDLEEFYKDMEILRPTPYNCMPERTVDCSNRRPISRNTHYLMSEEEAEQLRKDPRVLAVELTPQELGLVIKPMYEQTSTNWVKNSTVNNQHKNWGLLRCVEGEQRPNWGSNGTTTQSGTIRVNAEGRNVDVVIVDGMLNPGHPEFNENSDGISGDTRVIQYNWFQHNATVWPGNPNSEYVYTPYTGTPAEADNNHGMHVAGTAVGNTQGWARAANIYNINPYSTDVNGLDALYLFDYIRAFHAAKPVNPNTGRKNPTICNHSWGYGYNLTTSQVANIFYRGSFTNDAPFNAAKLINYGVYAFNTTIFAPARYPALDADIADAIADGIIQVGAASNDYTKIDVPGGVDYNNYMTDGVFEYYYHRGSSPSAQEDFICVGSINLLVAENKSDFSNTGPRVDIYAPGNSIISSVHTGGTTDPRSGSWRLNKLSGTSMASPQVCGALACALEIYPNMTQADAKEYILNYAKTGQITNTGGGFNDFTSLQGSENRYLFYYKERKDSGNTWPKMNYSLRTKSKFSYPRNKIRRTA
jgi:hypothetical protein